MLEEGSVRRCERRSGWLRQLGVGWRTLWGILEMLLVYWGFAIDECGRLYVCDGGLKIIGKQCKHRASIDDRQRFCILTCAQFNLFVLFTVPQFSADLPFS